MKISGLCRLSSEVEFKQLNSSTSVSNFSIAYNIYHGKNPDGSNKTKAVFFDCSAWGQRAEYIRDNIFKGDEVFLEATPDLEKWTDQNGQTKTKHSLIIESITLTKGRKNTNTSPV